MVVPRVLLPRDGEHQVRARAPARRRGHRGRGAAAAPGAGQVAPRLGQHWRKEGVAGKGGGWSGRELVTSSARGRPRSSLNAGQAPPNMLVPLGGPPRALGRSPVRPLHGSSRDAGCKRTDEEVPVPLERGGAERAVAAAVLEVGVGRQFQHQRLGSPEVAPPARPVQRRLPWKEGNKKWGGGGGGGGGG